MNVRYIIVSVVLATLASILLSTVAVSDTIRIWEDIPVDRNGNGVADFLDREMLDSNLGEELTVIVERQNPNDFFPFGEERDTLSWGFVNESGRVRAYNRLGTDATARGRAVLVEWSGHYRKRGASPPISIVTPSLLEIYGPTRSEGSDVNIRGETAFYGLLSFVHLRIVFDVLDGRSAGTSMETECLIRLLGYTESQMETSRSAGVVERSTFKLDSDNEQYINRERTMPCTLFNKDFAENAPFEIVGSGARYGIARSEISHQLIWDLMDENDLFRVRYIMESAAYHAGGETDAMAFIGDPFETDPGLQFESEALVLASSLPCSDPTEAGRYADGENGAIIDRVTGLMWARCPLGYVFDDQGTPDVIEDDSCTASGGEELHWTAAESAAGDDQTAGFEDWRLPGVAELDSLVSQSCSAPAIDEIAFPDTPASPFWTASMQRDTAWTVDFGAGAIAQQGSLSLLHTRLVRDTSTPPQPLAPLLTAAPATAPERDGDQGLLQFHLRLERPLLSDVTVDFTTGDGSGVSGVDYVATSGTLVIPAGTIDAVLEVPIIGDTVVEDDKSMSLGFGNASTEIRLGTARVMGIIEDDESTIRFADHPVQALEGDTGDNRALAIPVLLDKPAAVPISADYSLVDDSASVGSDVSNVTGTVVFNIGERVATIELETIGDDILENDEAFIIQLSNPVGATLAAGSGDLLEQPVVLVDDDGPGTYAALNDSGIVDCATDANALLDCPQTGFPGQDAEFGRDATANDPLDGDAGFSFTKLDSNGDPLGNQSAVYLDDPWDCVVDNVTGLFWEVKTVNFNDPIEDNDFRSARWTYTWYNSTGVNDGGDPGTENGGVCFGNTSCDTEKYTAAVNAEGLCGFNDWRLPTIDELYTIVDMSLLDLKHDTDYFPNQRLSSLVATPWSTTSIPDGSSGAGQAWELRQSGMAESAKDRPLYVRLVRGGIGE